MKKIIKIIIFAVVLFSAYQININAQIDTSWHMVTTNETVISPDKTENWKESYQENAQNMYVFGGADNSMWLERQIQISDDSSKKSILNFKGLQCDAYVFVKGEGDQKFTKINTVVKGPNASLDITSAVTPGEIATVKVWVTRNWTGMSEQKQKEYFRNAQMKYLGKSMDQYCESSMLGIKNGGISYETKSKLISINNVFVQTSVREHKMTVVIDGEKSSAYSMLKISVEKTSADDEVPNDVIVESDFRNGQQTVVIPWENPVLWELGKAHLYNLNVTALDNLGNTVDTYHTVRFGFREIWREGKELMLNGHALRIRIAPFAEGDYASMALYRGIGFNTILIQPNSTYWWSAKWNGMFPTEEKTAQYLSPTMADYADENGMAILMSAPAVDGIDYSFCTNSDVQNDYKDYLKMWFKENDYQNRPSVFTWTVSMNTGSTYDPDKIGQNTSGSGERALINNKAAEIIKSIDPTRLTYAHHGGNTDIATSLNDIETLNMYSNHMPIEEVEEFPSQWSKTGKRPWGACEFGVGFSEDFFNNNRVIPQFTEYLARYYGDDAYQNQDDNYVRAIEKAVSECSTERYKTDRFVGNDFFKMNKLDSSDTGSIFDNLHKWTMIGDYWGDYTKRVYRSWRTYGVNYGMFPFNMDLGFGATGKANYKNSIGNTYRELDDLSSTEKENLINKPEWASVYYDQFKEAVSPILIYIGGELTDENGNNTNDFTEKGHNYYSGETVRKSLITVWDGPDDENKTDIVLKWNVKNGEAIQKTESIPITLHAGDINKTAISFIAPYVSTKTKLTIYLDAVDNEGNTISTDSFDITVFPNETITNGYGWAIYDTVGKTKAELAKYGLNLREIQKGASLKDVKVLVIGKECITDKNSIPYTRLDVENGLKVLFMEQTEEGLNTLGFRTEDNVPRNSFIRDSETGLMSGISNEDLSNWRGSGSLLPEKIYNADDRKHAPHWHNTGSVASVTIEIPQQGAFLPIAVSEFDLQYSPLMSYYDGNGEMLFCQFDMEGRLKNEPAADKIMNNIIKYLDKDNRMCYNKQVVYYGEQSGDKTFLKALGFNIASTENLSDLNIENDILAVGELPIDAEKIVEFAANGGKVVVLPQWSYDFEQSNISKALGLPNNELSTSKKIMNLVKPDAISNSTALNGIGTNLLNFRRNITIDAFNNGNADGLVYEKLFENGGEILFSQLDIRSVCNTENKVTAVQNVQQPKMNTYRFYRQIFSNFGAETDSNVSVNLMN